VQSGQPRRQGESLGVGVAQAARGGGAIMQEVVDAGATAFIVRSRTSAPTTTQRNGTRSKLVTATAGERR
jgi:hypothetical protein